MTRQLLLFSEFYPLSLDFSDIMTLWIFVVSMWLVGWFYVPRPCQQFFSVMWGGATASRVFTSTFHVGLAKRNVLFDIDRKRHCLWRKKETFFWESECALFLA